MPITGVDSEVLVEADPLAGHASPGGVDEQLESPVVGRSPVVARRGGSLDPGPRRDRPLDSEIEFETRADGGREALAREASPVLPEDDVVLACELGVPP